jgi:hypothetical protein
VPLTRNTKTATARQVNAIATATLAAPGANSRWRIKHLSASVSAGTAILTVTSGATTILQAEVTVGGPFLLNIEDGIQALAANDAVSASLSAAGAANAGSVNLVGFAE